MEDRVCKNCHYYEYGTCYCEDFLKLFYENESIDNYRVSESGVLSEAVKEFMESYLHKHREDMDIDFFLSNNYKMSKTRINDINSFAVEVTDKFVRDYTEAIQEEIASIYEEYEQGELSAIKPPYYDGLEGIDVSEDFSCKFWW